MVSSRTGDEMFGTTYGQVRAEMVRIALDAGATGEEQVAACPGWTVADVVRHVTGLADDWLTGDLEVYASENWTAAQVARFAHLDLAETVAAWDERAPDFQRLLDDVSGATHLPTTIATVVGSVPVDTFPGGICVDLTQHVFDIAAALGAEVRIDDDQIDKLSKLMLGNIRLLWRHIDGPPITISSLAGLKRSIDGQGSEVTLAASSCDLFRALGGRRALDQVLQLDWNGPESECRRAARHLVVPFFRAPTEPVE